MTSDTRQRVYAILLDIQTNIGKELADAPEELAPLVSAALEGPLSENYDDARTEICEVLLHLGVLKGDE